MNIIESIRIALGAVAANKMRAALTMLGIIIGVGAVIALVAAGAGAQAQVTDRFESLGSNLLVVSPARAFFRGVNVGFGGNNSSQSLTNDDVEAIKALAPSVAGVAPEYDSNGQVVFGNKNTQTSVLGVTPEYLTVRKWAIERGRFVNELDLKSQAKVVVLGATVVEDLFGSTLIDPLGKSVKINRQNYQVIGIMASKGASGFGNQDDLVFIPLSTAQIRFGGAGNRSLQSINVMAASAELMDRAQAELTSVLRASHGLVTGQSNDFTVQNQTQIVEIVQQTSQTFTVLLASIAAISLVVGGIGIMNIMLVSVTERTREIGIRKAVGARRKDILAQFLVEAVVIGLVGGLIGVLAGYGGARIVTPLLGGSRAVVTSGSVVMALTVSIAVGLFFGIYPATRAAALNPIDALRYE
jgi:putative ABC transport system permease protein